METSLPQLLRTTPPPQCPTLLADRSTTWNPITSGSPFPQCLHSSETPCPLIPCLLTALQSMANRPINPRLALHPQRHSTRQNSTRTTAWACTGSDPCHQTFSRKPCHCPSQYRARRPTAQIHGNIITTSVPLASHSFRNRRIATSAQHVTRPSHGQAAYAFTATATLARSLTSVPKPVVAKPLAYEAI